MNDASKKNLKSWGPGQSGNPKGRPRGAGFAGQAREALAGRLPEILKAVADAAAAGDMQACRIVLDRLVPALKPVEATIEGMALPTGSLTQQATDILAAVARGEIGPTHAGQLIGSIAALAKITETDELKARIEALEAAHAKP